MTNWLDPTVALSEFGRANVSQNDPSNALVTCIMPTCDRRPFVSQAIRRFFEQDYTASELLVLDDGQDEVRDLMPEHPRVRYLRCPRASVGVKRNILCSEAAGDVIVHWDDDDWYPRYRVRRHVEALSRSGVVLSGTSTQYYYQPAAGRAYCYRYDGEPHFLTGSTMGYQKSFWRSNPFLDMQVGEDWYFAESVPRECLYDFVRPSLCVGTIHGGNVAPKEPHAPRWTPVALETIRALLASEFECPNSSNGWDGRRQWRARSEWPEAPSV